MSRAGTLQFVDEFSIGQADSILAEKFFDDTIFDMSTDQWFTNVSVIKGVAGQAVYTLPDEAIQIISVFFDDRILFPESERGLENFDPNWRDRKGTPIVFTTVNEQDRTFRIFKVPDFPGKDFIPLFGSPLGKDYQGYSVAVFYTEKVSEVPVWLELPIAFAILKKEYARESRHQDLILAELYGQLSDILFHFLRS